MSRIFKILILTPILLSLALNSRASGLASIYGIIEKVVFEPGDRIDRVQVWGAFMLTDGSVWGSGTTSKPKRGYLYFKLPDDADNRRKETIRLEWGDLKGVAGKQQAVAFGAWGYLGPFSDAIAGKPESLDGNTLRVRPATETPSSPDVYRNQLGVVKLEDPGTLSRIVAELREALR